MPVTLLSEAQESGRERTPEESYKKRAEKPGQGAAGESTVSSHLHGAISPILFSSKCRAPAGQWQGSQAESLRGHSAEVSANTTHTLHLPYQATRSRSHREPIGTVVAVRIGLVGHAVLTVA